MNGELKPIHTEADHAAAMKEVAHLWGAKSGTPEGDRLDVLATLIDAYEARCYPMDPPDPIEAIEQPTLSRHHRACPGDLFTRLLAVAAPGRGQTQLRGHGWPGLTPGQDVLWMEDSSSPSRAQASRPSDLILKHKRHRPGGAGGLDGQRHLRAGRLVAQALA